MTEQVEHLILEYLRGMRADIASMKNDLQDLRQRIASLEVLVGNVVSDVLRLNGRMDQMDLRIARIENRLELNG